MKEEKIIMAASEIFLRVFKCTNDNPPHTDCKICDRKFIDLELFKKQGFFKEGDVTYTLDEHHYPHDEHCSGTMCWCANRAKKENPEKWKKWLEDN